MDKKFEKWTKAAGIRAAKTIAQTAAATIGTSAMLSQVDWKVVISASLLAGLLSILTSVAGLPEVKKKTEVPRRAICEGYFLTDLIT